MRIDSKRCLLCGIILFVLFTCGPVIADNLTAEDYYNQGIDYAGLHQYTDAIASYDNATRINPDYTNAWYNRGNALLSLASFKEAVASYDKALSIKPDYSNAWINRGVALSKLARYEDAIASYDKGLAINPDDPDAWFNRGNALLFMEKYEDAVASYDKTLNIDTGYTNAQQNRVAALNQLGQNLSFPIAQQSQQPTPTMTLPPLSQQPTLKVPLTYAPIGAIALIVVLSLWRRKR